MTLHSSRKMVGKARVPSAVNCARVRNMRSGNFRDGRFSRGAIFLGASIIFSIFLSPAMSSAVGFRVDAQNDPTGKWLVRRKRQQRLYTLLHGVIVETEKKKQMDACMRFSERKSLFSGYVFMRVVSPMHRFS